MSGLKRAAAICVIKSEGQFLLLERAKEPNQGKFVPPGGKIDPFETPLQAALRELYEETGIELETMRFCGTLVETSPTDYNWISFIYLAEIPWLPAPPCEEGILHWVGIDQLLQVPTPPTDWILYRYLLDDKPFAFSAQYDASLNLLDMWEELGGIRVAGISK